MSTESNQKHLDVEFTFKTSDVIVDALDIMGYFTAVKKMWHFKYIWNL